MAVAAPNKSMQDGRWQNDSRKQKWTIDVDRDPPPLDVIERPGGTKFVMDTGAVDYKEEIIFSIKHKMPFPPAFLCYFYTIDGPHAVLIGRYTQNRAFMTYNAFSIGEEGMFAEVDEEYFYIKHFAETFGFGSGNHTFYGDDFTYRIRYELLNQKALYLGGKGYE